MEFPFETKDGEMTISFEGNFENGQLIGKGNIVSNGYSYEGYIEKLQMHGNVIEKWFDDGGNLTRTFEGHTSNFTTLEMSTKEKMTMKFSMAQGFTPLKLTSIQKLLMTQMSSSYSKFPACSVCALCRSFQQWQDKRTWSITPNVGGSENVFEGNFVDGKQMGLGSFCSTSNNNSSTNMKETMKMEV
jgi:hypothetical protein